ncbi:hypothetical protein F0267_23145 [Vibrio coralliilyticus]|uniref:Uncharacterized protein n=1 Tax=Vibrio coralliilyticus TaxID=190893 RepID=A0AAN0SBP3_9VIBR|nr:hypothetical protein [Vibrio coralliilyticus]AIW18808.1 hypothetical protein IX92_07005 [Vibrio coralliilyticus]NOH41127.1 hypothetical protein [Vibrio coralliilyticus]
MTLGYEKCTSPGCDAAMEVSQCSEQRSNANTQNYHQLKKLDLEAKRAELQRAQQEQPDATQH